MLRPYYSKAARGYQTRGGSKDAPDVDGTPFYVECKVGAKPNIIGAMKQANEALFDSKDSRPPLVITKLDRTEPLVTMRMREFLILLDCAESSGSIAEKIATVTLAGLEGK
jgi:hypothetical protein